MPIGRPQVHDGYLNQATEDAKSHLYRCLDKHGYGTFSSRHEILGVLMEEFQEVVDAVRNDPDNERLALELLDVAQVAIFGYACIKAGTIEW